LLRYQGCSLRSTWGTDLRPSFPVLRSYLDYTGPTTVNTHLSAFTRILVTSRLADRLRHIFPLLHATFSVQLTSSLIHPKIRPVIRMYRAPKPQYQPVSQDIKIGLTERVSLISSAGIETVKDIAFKNPRLVGGYNWIDDDEPSIAVPGTFIPTRYRCSKLT
jgi:hypothetical protein